MLAIIRPVEYNNSASYLAALEGKMKYITASQAAKKWGISQRRVQILCAQNRIVGVFKLGDNWAIPESAEKPKDKRKKLERNNERV